VSETVTESQSAPAVSAENIQPRADWLLVRRYKKTAMSQGGIHLPDSSRDLSQIGKVLRVGPDVRGLSAGEWIAFSGYAAPMFATNDYEDDLVSVKERDVLAVLDWTQTDQGSEDEV